MIQSKDLRIGNFISTTLGKAVSVKSISSDIAHVDIEGYRINQAYELAVLTGIPLSEGWLIKFGFDKVSDNDYRVGLSTGDGVELSIELLDEEACILRTHNKDGSLLDGFDYAYIKPAKHVHQLQNLYHALTGTDLSLTK